MDIMKLASSGPTMTGLPNWESRTQAGVKAHHEITEVRPQSVLLVLGEVDCRELLAKSDEPRQAILKTLTRFQQWWSTLGDLSSSTNLGLCGVNPPSRELVLQRKLWGLPGVVALFNDLLRDFCAFNGYKFVSFYRDVVDECGYLDTRYEFEDGLAVHLKSELVQRFAIDAVKRAFGVP